MTALIFSLAAFQGPAPGQAQPNPFGFLLPFILIFVVFYFLIMRPQSKRQKQHQAMVQALQKGDRVVTAGGFHGTVQGVDTEADTVLLEIADRVRITLSRGSIARVIKEEA